MRYVLFENHQWSDLLPLVYFRATFELLLGRYTLLKRLRNFASDEDRVDLYTRPSVETVVEQRTLTEVNTVSNRPTMFLAGNMFWKVLPDYGDSSWVGTSNGEIICVAADAELALELTSDVFLDRDALLRVVNGIPVRDVSHSGRLLRYPWHFIHTNTDALTGDWYATEPSKAGMIDPGSHVLNEAQVSLGGGARVMPFVVIDAEQGPVMIGEGVRVMSHSYIQGPCYIGKNTLVQPGTVLREGTSIGPVCKVGGEVECTIIQGYSNKQHAGFLGHSYLGEWVNIAAGCVNSDLKNTYGQIRSPINGVEVQTNERFMGCVIGDHTKLGINCAIPTGAVIGACSNVFVSQCPKFVPSYSWITDSAVADYDEEKAVSVARIVMARRKHEMSVAEEMLLRKQRVLSRTMESR